MRNYKKFISLTESFLMVVSLFAFCYFLNLNEDFFSTVSAAEDDEKKSFQDWVDYFSGGKLLEDNSWNSYSISATAEGAGCCFISKDGEICGTAVPDSCLDDSPFAEGALCSDTSFCEKGCCFEKETGIFDKNVLEFDCSGEWVSDPNCNLPGAQLGCCVLGTKTAFETLGQCEVDVLVRALGDGAVDWRVDVSEGECFALSLEQVEGACVLDGGVCEFSTEGDCFSNGGEFHEGVLCTSGALDADCEMTRQTSCVEGKDEVYFVDSCGNPANVYDSSRVVDEGYWDSVIEGEALCGSGSDDGNADDDSCGNCNRFAGGICSSATEDGFDVNIGDFYCRDTSCMFDGRVYENGESWCVYDGAIGEGRDVVGSRHWKYVCSQGRVVVEPCADYRNQICVQSNEVELDGTTAQFSNAACIANNWRECLNLNGADPEEIAEDDREACIEEKSSDCYNVSLYTSYSAKAACVEGAKAACGARLNKGPMDLCEDTLNCRVESVSVGNKFNFDVCLPRYPAGFSLTDERYQKTAESICSMGTQTCTVVYKPKTWGGCELVANGDCLTSKFAQEMNDFCMGLGDCGGSANILGEYSEGYTVKRDGVVNRGLFLTESWIKKLVKYSVPVRGEFAEVEDYTEFLRAAGVWEGINPGEVSLGEVDGGIDFSTIGQGLSGIGTAAGWAAESEIIGSTFGGSTTAGLSAFGGAAIGAGVGMIAGAMLAKSLGLSSGGSMLMAIGGAIVGAALGAAYVGLIAMIPVGTIIAIIGIVIMIIASFFGGDDCNPVEITYECRPWEPAYGGDDCEKCNGNPLKPCSEYRCASLGATCELINKGTEDELCVDGTPEEDPSPPIINWHEGLRVDEKHEGTPTGVQIIGSDTECVNAYAPIVIGIVTNEPAQCRFDIVENDFEDMSQLLGGNSYLYNHTTAFVLPDPSHGQSQGIDWTEDMKLFVKCKDRTGQESPGFFIIDICVVEGEDIGPPIIVKTTPKNGEFISFEKTNQDVEIVTNEFSTCRWDLVDREYEEMENNFVCNDLFHNPSDALGYVCHGALPVVNGSDNDYYIRCMDQPWLNDTSDRNVNAQSYVLNLRKPDSKIGIGKISPAENFEISTDTATIDLEVSTVDGGDYHWCSYSFSGYDYMIEMFETGLTKTHIQTFNRAPGRQKIYVECRDETGDFVQGYTEFDIVKDGSTPSVARVWQEGGFVNLVLNEEGTCRFSFDTCKFSWDDGFLIGTGESLRFAVVRGEGYYVKCQDEFGNVPNGCSVELVAT